MCLSMCGGGVHLSSPAKRIQNKGETITCIQRIEEYSPQLNCYFQLVFHNGLKLRHKDFMTVPTELFSQIVVQSTRVTEKQKFILNQSLIICNHESMLDVQYSNVNFHHSCIRLLTEDKCSPETF